MKLAISTYSLSRWRRETGSSIDDTLRVIKEMGVGAVEFSNLDDKPVENPIERAKQIRETCQKMGLAIAGYSVWGEFLGDEAARQKMIADTKWHVDIAAALGVRNMRHDVTRGPKPDAPPMTDEQVLGAVAPAVREVTEHGAKLGVRTSVENHGFWLQTADRVEGLIKKVNHPNYGVTLDMGNFLCLNQDPVDAVRRLVKYAVIVHAKDFDVLPKDQLPQNASGYWATPTEIALRGAVVGKGSIDVAKQLQIIQDAGYRGYLSLEFEGPGDVLESVNQGVRYLREKLQAMNALE